MAKLTAAEHARLLYRSALTELGKFQRANAEIGDLVQNALDRGLDPVSADIRADNQAVSTGLAAARTRYRDNAAMYGIMYLVESDYMRQTEPFTAAGDNYETERSE